MDCLVPKGLRNDDSIGDSAESSDFNLVDCHDSANAESRNDENQGEFMSSYRLCEEVRRTDEAIHLQFYKSKKPQNHRKILEFLATKWIATNLTS